MSTPVTVKVRLLWDPDKWLMQPLSLEAKGLQVTVLKSWYGARSYSAIVQLPHPVGVTPGSEVKIGDKPIHVDGRIIQPLEGEISTKSGLQTQWYFENVHRPLNPTE